jgi:hypothetical protein
MRNPASGLCIGLILLCVVARQRRSLAFRLNSRMRATAKNLRDTAQSKYKALENQPVVRLLRCTPGAQGRRRQRPPPGDQFNMKGQAFILKQPPSQRKPMAPVTQQAPPQVSLARRALHSRPTLARRPPTAGTGPAESRFSR